MGKHEDQIRDRVTRLTVEEIKTLRSKSDYLNRLSDEDIRVLRGNLRRLRRDGYSDSQISNAFGVDKKIVRLLFDIKPLEAPDIRG